jgi:myo-inositol 2-dehydrogenase / D-chiro-inositol 1-dehydrogenase
MSIRVGIMGAGVMGNRHGEILARDKRVEIVGIYDLSPQAAKRYADKFNIKIADTFDELINMGIDALYVLTPNALHVEPVTFALENNISVFSEKPMATDLEGALKIYNAAIASKGIYQIGLNRRFAPVYKYTKSLIDRGAVEPLLSHIKMNRGELIDPAWLSNTDLTGGFLYETPFHVLDVIRFLVGDIKKVQVNAQKNVYQELDDFAMILTFNNGHYATFASSAHSGWQYPFERIEIFGRHCSILTEEMEKVFFNPGLKADIVSHDYFQMPMFDKWGYVEENSIFVTSVLEGKPSIITPLDALKSVKVVDACYRSAANGGQAIEL